jgi:hypothetical protein
LSSIDKDDTYFFHDNISCTILGEKEIKTQIKEFINDFSDVFIKNIQQKYKESNDKFEKNILHLYD